MFRTATFALGAALVWAAPAAAQTFIRCGQAYGTTCPDERTQFELLRQLAQPPAPPPPQQPQHAVIRPLIITSDQGGWIHEYHERYMIVGAQGSQVEIRGLCASACTLVTAHVAKARLCFGANAALLFHKASTADGKPSNYHSQWMIDQYPADIRSWVVAMGGVEQMPVASYWTLPAPTLWKLGYRRCAD